jgi:hypothetical protein
MDHDDVLIVRACTRVLLGDLRESFIRSGRSHRRVVDDLLDIIILLKLLFCAMYYIHIHVFVYNKKRYYIRGEIFSRTVSTLRRFTLYIIYYSYSMRR